MRSALFLLGLAAAGCAEGSSLAGGGSGGGAASASTSSSETVGHSSSSSATASVASSGSSGKTDHDCPPNEFATDVAVDGSVTCAPLDSAAQASINAGCSIYWGWRDGCQGCGLIPSKWGRVGGSACANGVGANDTCSTFTLGGQSVTMFGLNTPGDVDENDTAYSGLHCVAGTSATATGPCGAGKFAVDAGGTVTCQDVDSAVLDYVRSSCSLHMGWRDGCTGCALPPTKWGSTTSAACASGVGGGNTCTVQTLGAEQVQLLGLDLDGDVNDDDKFYVGLACATPTATPTTSMGPCPAGQFLVGTNADGTIDCASPAAAVGAYFKGHCTAYLGWVDGCSACSTSPAKWGQVRDGFCTNGIGVGDTCTTATLGGATVNLFGLSTGGNVNDDDKFYMGFSCN